MKTVFTTIFTLICVYEVFAQSTINSIASGKWSVNSSWDLNRPPREGEVIVITAGNSIEFNETASLNNVVIRVYGTLIIRKNKELHLNKYSVVNILTGGKLTSENQAANSFIQIDGAVKYRGSKTYNQSWGMGVVNGLASANQSTGNIDFGGTGFMLGSLPVIWQDFNVFKTTDNKVKMIWVTSHETGNRLFEIQRGNNPQDLITIGSIRSSGNLNSQNVYTFIDDFPGTGNVFYRIKHVDPDGVYKFSAVRLVKLSLDQYHYLIYPNPTKGLITLCFTAELKQALGILLLRQNGQQVKSIVATIGMSRCHLDISREPAGIYYLRMLHPDGSAETLTFTKY